MAVVYKDHVVFSGETFTGNLSTVVAPPSGKRLAIRGWNLTMSGNTVAAQCTLALGSNAHASVRFPIAGTVAGSPLLNWTFEDCVITGNVDEVLNVNGGALGGILDGVIFVQEM